MKNQILIIFALLLIKTCDNAKDTEDAIVNIGMNVADIDFDMNTEMGIDLDMDMDVDANVDSGLPTIEA